MLEFFIVLLALLYIGLVALAYAIAKTWERKK